MNVIIFIFVFVVVRVGVEKHIVQCNYYGNYLT